MRILVIGQCTLHWGRMEFGNIGNYYIIEPLFRQLHLAFPSADIVTTFQMSDSFCIKEKIECIPMECYYGFEDNDLEYALKELSIAYVYNEIGEIIEKTRYIDEVIKSDLVVDFSGDIWGENADLIGPNRFLVGIIKDRIAQLLNKPTAMIAGSPGPFKRDTTLDFAKIVFDKFDLVTNREKISRKILNDSGFNTDKVYDLACPAFLFEPAKIDDVNQLINRMPLMDKEKPVVGFVLCGWNFSEGPFNKWPRDDNEYSLYIDLITFIVKRLDVNICLMSHSNGFEISPNFKLIKGRDFPIVDQLYTILQKTDISDSVFLLDGIYTPAETKTIISQFDMLISGRVHAAVAALSQAIPTLIIDYGHEPKAHKLKGFAQVADVEEYLIDIYDNLDRVKEIVLNCWSHRTLIRYRLTTGIPKIKSMAIENFELLKELLHERQ